MTFGRMAQRREHTGEFSADQQQRLAQQAADKINDLNERLAIVEGSLLQGRTSILMQNTTQTLTAIQLLPWVIRAYGATTAARTLKGFPCPETEADYYTRLIHNNTSGGNNIDVTDTKGQTAPIGAGGTAVFLFTSAGPVALTL